MAHQTMVAQIYVLHQRIRRMRLPGVLLASKHHELRLFLLRTLRSSSSAVPLVRARARCQDPADKWAGAAHIPRKRSTEVAYAVNESWTVIGFAKATGSDESQSSS